MGTGARAARQTATSAHPEFERVRDRLAALADEIGTLERETVSTQHDLARIARDLRALAEPEPADGRAARLRLLGS